MNIRYLFRTAALALFGMLLANAAFAQAVTQQPQYVDARAVKDLGNGPMQIMMLNGSMGVFTSQGSGVGGNAGVSGTGITLTASAAANPPCVGCQISGAGITVGTTVAAFNGTTGITLSAAMAVANGTALSWGKACPAVGPSGNPPISSPVALLAAANGADVPFYTGAKMCAAGLTGPGGQFVTFAIGAH